jgi:hypothetical protein
MNTIQNTKANTNAKTKNIPTIMNGSPMPMQEMAAGQLQAVAGGGKRQGAALTDLIAWVLCGFGHTYVDTGKTKITMDGIIPTRFKQVRCKECGHKTWVRVGVEMPF